MKTSSELEYGAVYTREELAEKYGIIDKTLWTGISRPKGHSSIWLFVTEEKSPDQTQYRDELRGDVLEWDGQTSGRKDKQIIEHEANGLELILFYRKHKSECPGGGFRYEGVFRYVSHSEGKPSHFKLRRVSR